MATTSSENDKTARISHWLFYNFPFFLLFFFQFISSSTFFFLICFLGPLFSVITKSFFGISIWWTSWSLHFFLLLHYYFAYPQKHQFVPFINHAEAHKVGVLFVRLLSNWSLYLIDCITKKYSNDTSRLD